MRLVLLSFGLICCLASCSLNNVEERTDLNKFFTDQQVVGVFGLFDNGQGSFIVSDKHRFRDSAWLPASTFKIVNSLIGLETGTVKDDSTVIKWDGVVRPMAEWNQDLSMYRAFRLSAVPWYQELARRIGQPVMQHWIDTLGYGKGYGKTKIDKIDTFWLDNSFKVSPDEQLGLVKRLYFSQLPFQHRTQEIVCDMMLMEDNANYKLAYKTGWGRAENGSSIAWIIGWVEENKHPYFFVQQFTSTDPKLDIPAVRLALLKKNLSSLGFLEGKR
ncbi:MAG: class D beta-lactamase [Bacteroidetes bacterium]|nr:class D beta-lactamase [Bacteroidota bacterium]